MPRILVLTAIIFVAIGGAQLVHADDDTALIVKESATDFHTTVERLRTEVEKRGATIVATVDHAAAARANGFDLRPTTVIIFGNPALGTPLMQGKQTAAIDLPLRVLIWEDANRKAHIGYWPPSRMIDAHGIENLEQVTDKMAAALKAITDAAAR